MTWHFSIVFAGSRTHLKSLLFKNPWNIPSECSFICFTANNSSPELRQDYLYTKEEFLEMFERIPNTEHPKWMPFLPPFLFLLSSSLLPSYLTYSLVLVAVEIKPREKLQSSSTPSLLCCKLKQNKQANKQICTLWVALNNYFLCSGLYTCLCL